MPEPNSDNKMGTANEGKLKAAVRDAVRSRFPNVDDVSSLQFEALHSYCVESVTHLPFCPLGMANH